MMHSAEPASDIIFYDGTCGLCHHSVRWVLARDPEGIFRFAPLQSESFLDVIPAELRAALPDSIVVSTQSGEMLTRSSATLYIIDRLQLAGLWRLLRAAARLVPVAIRDFFYDAVARVRYKIFGRESQMCPVLPPHLRNRFLL